MQTNPHPLLSSENQLLQLSRRGSRGQLAHLRLPGFLSPSLRAFIDRWIYPWLALVYAWLSPIIVGIVVAIPMLLLFMAAATLAVAAGAWAYYRLAHAVPPVLVLGGMLVCVYEALSAKAVVASQST